MGKKMPSGKMANEDAKKAGETQKAQAKMAEMANDQKEPG